MKTANKTPYEIRLELLQLAQDVLSKQHYARAAANATDSDKTFPVTSAPTTEEIIAEAEKMNNFISKANPNH